MTLFFFDVVPGFQRLGPRFERLYTPLDLHGPGLLRARIGGAVETGQQLGCDFGARFYVKPECFSEHGSCGFDHVLILRFVFPPSKQL